MRHIKNQLLLILLLLVLIPLISAGLWSYFQAKEILEHQIQQDNMRFTKQTNKIYIEHYITELEQDLETLAKRVDMKAFSSDPAYKEKLFEEWQIYRDVNPFIDYVYIGTEDNQLWVNPRYTPPPGFKCTERPWYIAAKSKPGQIVWTDPYAEAQTGVLHISAAKLLPRIPGTPEAVMVIDVGLAEATNALKRSTVEKGMESLILNPKGNVLFYSGYNLEILKQDQEWKKTVLTNPEGIFLYNVDDGKKFLCFTTVKSTGWKLVTLIPRGTVEAQVAPIKRVALIIGLLSSLIAILLAHLLSRRFVVDPLLSLATQAEAISRGDLDQPPTLQGAVEFQNLAMALDRMRLSIRDQINGLNEARKVAEQATQAKSDFLARMSHELRTPLHGIIGLCHLLLQTDLKAQQLDYVNKLQSQARHLLNVINDILDISKIEAGNMTIENTEFDLEETVTALFNMFEQSAKAKGLELLVYIGKDVPTMLKGDPLRLQQVLINLINNAIKFTPQGSVVLRIEKTEEPNPETVVLKFSVQDSGIGMTQEQLSKIFSPFFQAESSTSRKYGGTGLGLAISRQLVELMGGKLEATSVYGQGSTFYFTLPFLLAAKHAEAARFKRLSELRGKRVLVVDDSEISREILINYLENLGFQADAADSGQEALNKILKQGLHYDILVVDWKMPDMDGIETIRRLSEGMGGLSLPPIVMASAYDLQDLKSHLEGLDVKVVLNKPHTPSQLADAVLLAAFKKEEGEVVLRPQDVGEDSPYKKRLVGRKILLVEDNQINQEIAREILLAAGAEVHTAGNGLEALESLEKESYDLVLMDLEMPVMNGMEATRRIRENSKTANLPVIALTAHAISGFREECLAIGMNDFITKPFTPEVMIHTICRHLACCDAPPAASALEATSEGKSPDSKAIQPDLPVLAGIDKNRALESVMGNRDLFFKLLLEFIRTFEKVGDEIIKLSREGEYGEVYRIVHSIKGASANLGALQLSQAAAALETSLKDKGLDLESQEWNNFVSALQTVLANRSYLEKLHDAEKTSSAKEPKAFVSPEEVKGLLLQLRKIIGQNDFGAADYARQHLEGIKVLNQDKLQNLLQCLDAFDYEKALLILEEIEELLKGE